VYPFFHLRTLPKRSPAIAEFSFFLLQPIHDTPAVGTDPRTPVSRSPPGSVQIVLVYIAR
jgi:hypothetical protein